MSQRQITLPTDDLDFILEIISKRRESLCRENRKALIANNGIIDEDVIVKERDELVDNIDRINKHILMTFKVLN